VLATQNPVDLDYKGLSNTGTWFIGRLQTERDKSRVMEGLEGAAASAGSNFNRQKMEEILAGLGNRVFLMNNTHEDEPVVFQTRWSLSYLRGPLTRSQIKQLMDPYKATMKAPAVAATAPSTATMKTTPQAAVAAAPVAAEAAAPVTLPAVGLQPTLTADIPQYFIPVRGKSSGAVYQPMLVGAAKVHVSDAKIKVEASMNMVALTTILDQAVPVDWETARDAGFTLNDLEKKPAAGTQFGDLPAVAAKAKSYTAWEKDFVTWLYGSQKLELLRSPSTGQVSKPGEAERDFRVRLQQSAREQRDRAVAELRQKYSLKINALQEKVRKAQQAVDREKSQADQAKLQTAFTFGATLLGAFTGRKVVSSTNINKAASTLRGVSRSAQQQSDVGRAEDTVETYQKQLEDLNAQFKEESDALESKIDPASEALETVTIRPKKTDIDVQLVALAWAPYWQNSQGKLEPAW